jgi:steroid 5-alpha reductase family enzyme
MALLSTAWGMRLTINFALKGGFSGGEDYRWKEIRSWPGFDRGWEFFNFGFVCLFQQMVVLAFASPAAAAMGSKAPLNGLDVFAALLYACLVTGEAIADLQMMRFQTEKYRRIRERKPLGPFSKGFIDTGLWAYSRHPNYVRRPALSCLIVRVVVFYCVHQ